MSFMMAFGWASVMLCLGVVLRAKIPFLRNMLVPSSVIAGVLGLLLINITGGMNINIGTDTVMFTDIVNHLFTISFISISLTTTDKTKESAAKNVLRGAVGMGLVWCFLYALTPLIGAAVIALVGKPFGMDSIYGTLIQFAFCQGPGQAASYGSIFEQYGWANASTVAIAFSAVGFIVAFVVGIPVAKLGLKKGLCKHCGRIDDTILKGYLKKEEQTEVMVKDTTCNSNIETLAFHFAIIGVCYILAVGIAKVFSYLPSFLGSSMSSMMFMNGMYAAYFVRWVIRKLKVDYLLENTLQSKITGWTADYLVVCAFMAVSVQIIGKWLVPIVLEAALITAVTFVCCYYFGRRFGGSNDFERTLAAYGMSTGTVPSGIALIRIVDPDFKTTTSIELGACNLVMMASMPIYMIILAAASHTIGMGLALILLAVCCVGYLIVLKLSKAWGKPTYSLK